MKTNEDVKNNQKSLRGSQNSIKNNIQNNQETILDDNEHIGIILLTLNAISSQTRFITDIIDDLKFIIKDSSKYYSLKPKYL